MAKRFHQLSSQVDAMDALALIDDYSAPEEADAALDHLGIESSDPLRVRIHAFIASSSALWMPGFPLHAIAFAIALCALPVSKNDRRKGRFDADAFMSLMRAGRHDALQLNCDERTAKLLEMRHLPPSVEEFTACFGKGLRNRVIVSVQTSARNVYLWPLVGEPHAPMGRA